jgi:hypothetical protein
MLNNTMESEFSFSASFPVPLACKVTFRRNNIYEGAKPMEKGRKMREIANSGSIVLFSMVFYPSVPNFSHFH